MGTTVKSLVLSHCAIPPWISPRESKNIKTGQSGILEFDVLSVYNHPTSGVPQFEQVKRENKMEDGRTENDFDPPLIVSV